MHGDIHKPQKFYNVHQNEINYPLGWTLVNLATYHRDQESQERCRRSKSASAGTGQAVIWFKEAITLSEQFLIFNAGTFSILPLSKVC
jgi:hypothetical protein